MIETLIAINILVVGVLALLALMVSVVGAGQTTTRDILARAFAQEGIEAVRVKRDANWQSFAQDSTTAFTDGLANPNDAHDVDGILVINDFDVPSEWLSFVPNSFEELCGTSPTQYRCTTIWRDDTRNIFFQTTRADFDPTINPNIHDSGFDRLITLLSICRDVNSTTETITQPTAECLENTRAVGIRVNAQIHIRDHGNVLPFAMNADFYDWQK